MLLYNLAPIMEHIPTFSVALHILKYFIWVQSSFPFTSRPWEGKYKPPASDLILPLKHSSQASAPTSMSEDANGNHYYAILQPAKKPTPALVNCDSLNHHAFPMAQSILS